ncbi:MAG: chromosome partitioning ATPase [Candidatus Brocadia sp.]|jgi:chromosome partitioning protein|uniref:Chromosome segregation ATPase n=1 Tax=Candidatus Brocadia fulgida TaxID=380242 RepID=A0A0M2UWY3_9BACT|nr:MAG: chromosome segregation ATPase [Candidatus Brocadia fulgida]MCC6325146.1 ParA family protein [Candidatus Brocadia sp.]MCE7910617.1 ParA family protein [Candidatus Brocadia sp. AMX3]OQY97890.1 MAG: chromosome partitioning ATPase [Candidatus Brocadia sp. UTAMX2]MBV6518988.1 Sporulation initiation inhibitor protein Soj [Candidatus Brocadia fulgida]
MRSIALTNQKGGVAKTTTTVNLGACLAQMGKRVLLVDLDPQGNLSSWLGLDIHNLERSMYNVFLEEVYFEEILTKTCVENLTLAPSNVALAGVERILAHEKGRDLILRKRLSPVISKYDYIMLDCPPSLGLITINALTFVKEVFIPLETKVLALNGLVTLMNTVQVVKERLNHHLEVTGIIACRFDGRTNLSNEVYSQIKDRFKEKVFNTIIRENTRLAECPISGKPITLYAPDSPGAVDYTNLAKEVLEREKNGASPDRTPL